jgi:hypothetical protein
MKIFGAVVKTGFLILVLLSLGYSQVVMYIDPPRLPSKAVGKQCTLKVRIRNAAGIYGWAAGFYFNPDVLEGVSVAEDSFLKYAHGVPHSTFFISGAFDNTNGVLNSCACTQMGDDSGGVGDGPLMQVIMEVKGTGSSIIDLANEDRNTLLSDYDADGFTFFCHNGFYGDEGVLPTPSFQISSGAQYQTRPAVVWNNLDDEFLVTWEEYPKPTRESKIMGRRSSPAGSLLGTIIDFGGGGLFYQFSPCVSWNGTNYLAVYSMHYIGSPQGDFDIKGATVSSTGFVGPEITICNEGRFQSFPTITWNGSNHLVVWEARRLQWENPSIYGQLIDASGNLVSGNFAIATSSKPVTPSTASDGTYYLVIWIEGVHKNPYGDIYGQLVDASGTLIGSSFQIAIDRAMPALSFDGTNYLVVYQKPTTSINWDIYGQRVSSTGAIVGSEFTINAEAGDQTMPQVIYEPSSGKYLVIWVSEQSMPAIYAQRVNKDGTLSGAPFLFADASYHQLYPSIAYGSTNEMCVWGDLRNGTDFDIFGYNPTPPTGIEMSSFSAEALNSGIILTWRTESESSIVEYSIKRRDGKNEYRQLTRIPGSGSSPSPQSYSYRDENVKSGTGYYYKLGAVKIDGTTKWYGPVSAMISDTKPFLSISPNPFTTLVNVKCHMPGEREYITLHIYNVSGRLVKSFSLLSPHSSPITKVSWDGTDNNGEKVPPGAYFIHVKAGDYKETKKVIMLR